MLTDLPGLIKHYLANFRYRDDTIHSPTNSVLFFTFPIHEPRVCRSERTQFASLPAGFFPVCLKVRPVTYHQRKIDFSAAGHRIIKLPAESACG